MKSSKKPEKKGYRFANSNLDSPYPENGFVGSFWKPERIESEEYLEWVRNRPCLIHQTVPSDPHHLKTVGSGGSDYTAVPFCRACHDTYHRKGLNFFESTHKINLWKEAHRLLVEYFQGL